MDFLGKWNIVRYTLASPLYDPVVGLIRKYRKTAIAKLGDTSRKRVLLVGAGTGLDFEFFPPDCDLFAVDITPRMVTLMRRRARKMGMKVTIRQMDARNLDYAENSFDCVVLNLILAVMPEPEKCAREVARILKHDGSVVIFDKFLHPKSKSNLFRSTLNILTTCLFTSINRRVEEILKNSGLNIISDESVFLNGNFRILQCIPDSKI